MATPLPHLLISGYSWLRTASSMTGRTFTPSGTSTSDLQEVKSITFERPEGWMTFDISKDVNDDGDALYV
jgi:hypothetical protein